MWGFLKTLHVSDSDDVSDGILAWLRQCNCPGLLARVGDFAWPEWVTLFSSLDLLGKRGGQRHNQKTGEVTSMCMSF